MILCKEWKFQIVKLEWERIFLHLDIETDCEKQIKFLLEKKGEKDSNPIEIFPMSVENGTYSFVLNITAMNGRNFLENGKWTIIAVVADTNYLTTVSNKLAYELDNKTRIFPYGAGKFAYSVYFGINTLDGENLSLYLKSCFIKENPGWKKRQNIQDAVGIKGKIKQICRNVAVSFIRIMYYGLSTFLPKNGKHILFMSETKDYIWGNLQYIDSRMKERGLDSSFELMYFFKNSVNSKGSIASWFEKIYKIAKSDFIFVDDYVPVFGYFKLSEKTKLIQVWHAGEGFKSVGYSRFGKEGSPFPTETSNKAYDYVTVGSKKLIHVYEEVFGIEKEAFLPFGMARLDDFLDKNRIEKFKSDFYKNYPQFKNKKIILFAPTFRGADQKEAYYDYEQLNLKEIFDFCSDEYVFLSKVHPFVKDKIQIPEEYLARIFDFSDYKNINDLYYVTDILITDYSSNYYEYALMKKPMLFYTYDREKYELIRGVHRNVKEHAPGKICDTFEELMNALREKDYEYENVEKFVKDNFAEYDGHACDRIIDYVILKKDY